MANRWLLKEEPSHYSFDDLVRDKKTTWSGVHNNLALKHLRSALQGDLFFYYHTGDERAVIGIGRIASDPYPDPEAGDPRLVVVDVEAVKKLAHPVPLSTIKQSATLQDFALVRISRLSVMPVTTAQWQEIEDYSK